MKSFVLFLLLFVFIVSCGNPKQPMVEEDNSSKIVLTYSDLLKAEIIELFIQQGAVDVEKAKGFFLRGIDFYENEKQLDSASVLFQNSLLAEPTAKAFFAWGKVLKDQKEYIKAIKAYHLAEQLGYEPYSSILYETAKVYALQDKESDAGDYLTYAIQAGFNNIDKIENDPDLAQFRSGWHYEDAIRNGFRGVGDPKKMMWLQFKKQFPKLDENYQTKIKFKEDELSNMSFISFDFERYVSEMRDVEFSRETSKSFYYVGNVYETDKYFALLYIEKDEFGTEWYPVKYRLSTFNKEGKLIDKKVIAGNSGDVLKVKRATFFPNGNINVELFEVEMEKDIDDVGFSENKILGTKLLGEEKFEISTEGKINSVQSTDLSAN